MRRGELDFANLFEILLWWSNGTRQPTSEGVNCRTSLSTYRRVENAFGVENIYRSKDYFSAPVLIEGSLTHFSIEDFYLCVLRVSGTRKRLMAFGPSIGGKGLIIHV